VFACAGCGLDLTRPARGEQPKVQSACQLWLSVVKGVGAEREQRDPRFARLRSVCAELLLV